MTENFEAQLEGLRTEQGRIDKEVAICRDRLERHDGELRDLIKDVHETKRNVNEMKLDMASQFTALHITHKSMNDNLESMGKSIKQNTEASQKVSTVYRTLAVIFGAMGTLSGVVVGIGKVIGWW